MTDPEDQAARVPRRAFLRGAGVLGALVGVAGAAYGIDDLLTPSPHRAAKRRRPAAVHNRSAADLVEIATLPSGTKVPTASWVSEENAHPGTLDWIVTGVQSPRSIEGFASQVSATVGDTVTLFVNTVARSFHVEAYRMGYYQGLGARLVWRSDDYAGTAQPPPAVAPGVHTVSCPWTESATVKIGSDWPPGAYLLKLVGSGGQQQFVPLCIRDDLSHAAFVVQHSVTTWQAYNLWGGFSLYYGAANGIPTFLQTETNGKNFADRARIVSFDRPYCHDWAQGASDFMGNEFPLVYDMERLGLDVTYRTDVDLHQDPLNLLQHQALLSLGHDEYWSLAMREAATTARDSGVNLAFLGANACYRPIRFADSPLGSNRLQICYKSAAEDPLNGVDDSLVTPVTWDSTPTDWAESQLIGAMYQDVGAEADLVVGDPSSWLWSGTALREGQALSKVVVGEYDRYDPAYPSPGNVEILAHSPVANRGPGRFSDVTWYTAPGGGGVLDTGTASWVNRLANSAAIPSGVFHAPVPGVTEPLLRAMENVYSVLGLGPGATRAPSTSNATGESVASVPPASPTA
ncbi:MAG: N,N-dimethylformamidase beta subunit family domain-containing protein [Acidimicrobiales bacterium]